MPTVTEIARHWGTSQPYASQCKKAGCPTHSLKAADNWRAAQASKRAGKAGGEAEEKKGRGRPLKPAEPSKTGDQLLDALNNSVLCADAAFRAYQRAVTGNLSTQSARLSEHTKANTSRLLHEKAYREELERRTVLVEKSAITERVRRALEPVLRRLNKLAQECGPQCNEHEPLKAVMILQRQVDEIKSSIHNVLVAL